MPIANNAKCDKLSMNLIRPFPPPLRPAIIGDSIEKPLGLAVYVILGAAALSPLLWTRIPPLVDYPNHLARMWILVHRSEIPELAANYIVHWRILPDLAMDLVVSVLSLLMPVEQAGRVFVAVTMLALVAGTLTLHRALHGRLSLWPICSVLFVYNAALFWGFVNCLFATGVYLFAFSGWIATRDWRMSSRILMFSIVGSVLLLLHLFAFGLYGLSVVTYELAVRICGRRLSVSSCTSWIVTWLQFVPGVVLWYISLPDAGSTLTLYGDFGAKLYALISPFDFGYQPTGFDTFFELAMWCALIFATISRSLRLAPGMRVTIAALIVAAVLMPNRMSGSWSADIRLPVTLPFVIIASTRLEMSRKGITSLLATSALMLFGLRIWAVSQSWREYDHWFAEFRSASAVISPGARLLIVEAPIPEDRRRLSRVPSMLAIMQPAAFIHLGALAVIDRAAFFPYMFAGWTTIDVTQRNKAVSQREGVPARPDELIKSADPGQTKALEATSNLIGELPHWRNWPETFDFVLWIDFSGAPKPELKQLQPLAKGSFFDIYRVIRPQAR